MTFLPSFPESHVRSLLSRGSVLVAATGTLIALATLGAAGTAAAGAYHSHRHVAPRDFNATVDSGFASSGPSVGAWRFRTFRRGGCDSAYPMHEDFGCGSPTGGPVGGMGS